MSGMEFIHKSKVSGGEMIINKETFIIARDSVDYAIKLEQQLAKLKADNEKLIWAIDEICKTMNEEKVNLGMMNHVADVARNAKEALGE